MRENNSGWKESRGEEAEFDRERASVRESERIGGWLRNKAKREGRKTGGGKREFERVFWDGWREFARARGKQWEQESLAAEKKKLQKEQKNRGCRISVLSLAVSFTKVAAGLVGLLWSSILSQGNLFLSCSAAYTSSSSVIKCFATWFFFIFFLSFSLFSWSNFFFFWFFHSHALTDSNIGFILLHLGLADHKTLSVEIISCFFS